MVYYIADTHFGLMNVIRFDNRPFADTTLMDEVLVHNWNERVTEDDTVYILGDAFWKNEENRCLGAFTMTSPCATDGEAMRMERGWAKENIERHEA